MTFRGVPIMTFFALSLSAFSAPAQTPGSDAAPYPIATDSLATPPAKPIAKPMAKPVAAPPVVLPPIKPEAIKSATAPAEPVIAPAREQQLGWSVVTDPATGVQLGPPTRMVPRTREGLRGTLWSSAHDEVQIETFRIVDPGLKLSALFEREKKEPNTRRAEYSLLRDNTFFVSGLQGLKRFSVSASLRNGEVRGFTMLYDQGMETIVTPVMAAISSAFNPFPQRSAPFAALARAVEYGNGLIVSAQGHIVTDGSLTRGCQVIVASGFGDAERVAEDNDNGLVLLRVYGPRPFKPLEMSRDVAAAKAADVTLAGIPDPKEQNGAKKITELKARVTDGNSIELPQADPMAGFSGAAALDAQGKLIGMAEMRNAVLASITPALPPVRLIPAATIRGFLDANNVPAVGPQTTEASASVVRIICVRK